MNKLATAVALALAGCQQQPSGASNAPDPQSQAQTAEAPARSQANGSTEAPAPSPDPAPAVTPQHPASLPEPRGPIDPKSVEAAGQVVQHFGALIETNRYREAAQLWGDAGSAAAFTARLQPGTHLEIGDLGRTEGAAGSIYTTVPVVFYRDQVRKPADIILRRVNDVPGSTDAQRRWHIERVEWK